MNLIDLSIKRPVTMMMFTVAFICLLAPLRGSGKKTSPTATNANNRKITNFTELPALMNLTFMDLSFLVNGHGNISLNFYTMATPGPVASILNIGLNLDLGTPGKFPCPNPKGVKYQPCPLACNL